jgi:antibiotic biosynthesis monooxygenase (ABM) superfamily enzyme
MIHVAILRKVRPGQEAEFERIVGEFFREAATVPGVEGAYLMRPAGDKVPREYGVLRSFASEAEMEAFYASPLYQRLNDALRPVVEGEPQRRPLHGLEAFFRGNNPPPRWKMFLLTWLGVTPLVYGFGMLVQAAVGSWPRFVVVALTTLPVVATLAWVVMPALTSVFRRWLRPET